MDNYAWLDKKTPRSVEQLKLWPENPRLNPEEKHIRISDFAEDLTYEKPDRDSFLELIKSIYLDGFRPYDPIIIWKSEDDGNFYVAEGNRRVLALKLLLEPSKSPRSIRSTVRKYSDKINKELIRKVKVNVAPTFEEAEWYINQRNNASSLQRTWSRIQQQRWILELYTRYSGNIETVSSKTKMTATELENFIRPLKIRDFINDPEIKNHLSAHEITIASSIKFPITILERFFSNPEARLHFKIIYDGFDVRYEADKESFYVAFADLIKKIIYRDSFYKDSETKIDTRTITTNFEGILNSIPKVLDAKIEEVEEEKDNDEEYENDESQNDESDDSETEPAPPPPPPLKNNPNRANLVLNIYTLKTDKARLLGLFNEFKSVPLSRYPNTISSALRVFLDLSVLEYINSEAMAPAIAAHYKADIKEVPLKKRLEYIKTKTTSQALKNIIGTLLTSGQQFSVDVLNGFVHGQSTHYIDKTFLNKFWDFLFPLFQELLEIEEK